MIDRVPRHVPGLSLGGIVVRWTATTNFDQYHFMFAERTGKPSEGPSRSQPPPGVCQHSRRKSVTSGRKHPIDLELQVGKGSIFSVALPVADPRQAEAAAAQAEPSTAARSALRNARVLVIENDAAVLTAMSSRLARWGCDVAIAPSGDEAAKLARTRPPQAIIADLHVDHAERGSQAVAKVRRAVGPSRRRLSKRGSSLLGREPARTNCAE